MRIRRKLYRRGSSFETTIPKPLLFALDEKKRYFVVFRYEQGRWFVEFEENKSKRVSK